ncbi:MAG: hypothetical protein GY769_17620 [bacterium]|nr:hypothetical protein [bacterium]
MNERQMLDEFNRMTKAVRENVSYSCTTYCDTETGEWDVQLETTEWEEKGPASFLRAVERATGRKATGAKFSSWYRNEHKGDGQYRNFWVTFKLS